LGGGGEHRPLFFLFFRCYNFPMADEIFFVVSMVLKRGGLPLPPVLLFPRTSTRSPRRQRTRPLQSLFFPVLFFFFLLSKRLTQIRQHVRSTQWVVADGHFFFRFDLFPFSFFDRLNEEDESLAFRASATALIPITSSLPPCLRCRRGMNIGQIPLFLFPCKPPSVKDPT